MISLLLAAAPIKVPIGNAPTAGPLRVAPGLTYAPHHAYWPGWLTHTLGGIFIVSALALIALLAMQTTKQEGLSGTLGGRVESSYARLGAEEQLKRVTGVAAVAFVIVGTILSLTGI